MTLSFETTALFNNITYTKSTMKFATILSSSLEMSNVEITQITLNQYLYECIECQGITWKSIAINNILTTSQYAIFFSKSVIDQIMNLTLTDLNSQAMLIVKTNITLIDNLLILNTTTGINLEQSQLNLFQNSVIRD